MMDSSFLHSQQTVVCGSSFMLTTQFIVAGKGSGKMPSPKLFWLVVRLLLLTVTTAAIAL